MIYVILLTVQYHIRTKTHHHHANDFMGIYCNKEDKREKSEIGRLSSIISMPIECESQSHTHWLHYYMDERDTLSIMCRNMASHISNITFLSCYYLI